MLHGWYHIPVEVLHAGPGRAIVRPLHCDYAVDVSPRRLHDAYSINGKADRVVHIDITAREWRDASEGPPPHDPHR